MISKYYFSLGNGVNTSLSIPTFSEILDVFSENNMGCVLVKEHDKSKPLKDIHILVELCSDINNVFNVEDRFKYYKTVKTNYINNNNYVSSQSNQINIDINSILEETAYLIFIDDNMQLSEKRTMKLDELSKDYE